MFEELTCEINNIGYCVWFRFDDDTESMDIQKIWRYDGDGKEQSVDFADLHYRVKTSINNEINHYIERNRSAAYEKE